MKTLFFLSIISNLSSLQTTILGSNYWLFCSYVDQLYLYDFVYLIISLDSDECLDCETNLYYDMVLIVSGIWSRGFPIYMILELYIGTLSLKMF